MTIVMWIYIYGSLILRVSDFEILHSHGFIYIIKRVHRLFGHGTSRLFRPLDVQSHIDIFVLNKLEFCTSCKI